MPLVEWYTDKCGMLQADVRAAPALPVRCPPEQTGCRQGDTKAAPQQTQQLLQPPLQPLKMKQAKALERRVQLG